MKETRQPRRAGATIHGRVLARRAAAFMAALLLHAGPARAEPPPTKATPSAPADAATPGDRALATERYLRGKALFEQQRWAPALAEFLEARRLSPSSWSPTYGAAHCLKMLGRSDEAADMYAALLRDFGDKLPAATKQDALTSLEEVRTLVGAIEIEGAEPGATISIDQKARGDYPQLAPLRVPSGSHVVRVYKEGFEPFETSVDVVSGKTVPVKARLVRLTLAGRLEVKEQSGKALDILLDGNIIGRTPWEGPIAAGDHTVELRGDESLGALPRRIAVLPDRRAEVVLTAEQLDASLEVAPTPGDASVALDAIFVGRGRWAGHMRPGPHVIKLVADGYFPEERKVELARGSATVIPLALRRDPSSPVWRQPGRFSLSLVGSIPFTPTLGGDVGGACGGGACGVRDALGQQVVVDGAYEIWNGFGFGVSVGYLRMQQESVGRRAALNPVGLAALPGAVDDTLKLRGFRFGVWASYKLGADRFPIRLRLGAGGLAGTVSDIRRGSFQAGGAAHACPSPAQAGYRADDPLCFSIGTATVAPPATWFYLDPEVRLGARVAPHLELSAGVEWLFLFTAGHPRWDDKLGIYAGKSGLGRFDPERLTATVVAVLMPGVGLRYEF